MSRGRFRPLGFLGLDGGLRWPSLTLAGHGLLLQPPSQEDYAAWSALRGASRDFLAPWEPPWLDDDLERGSFRRRIKRYHQEIDRDEAYPFLVFLEDSHTLIGGLTISNIRRGAAQAGTLGYWMGAVHAGKGHMGRAVALACAHAFRGLALERIEAACVEENAASARVLTRAGFRREGLARRYLNIAGVRRDHVLFALLREDASPLSPFSAGQ